MLSSAMWLWCPYRPEPGEVIAPAALNLWADILTDWRQKPVLRAHEPYGLWQEGVGMSEQPEYGTEQCSEHVAEQGLALGVSHLLGE